MPFYPIISPVAKGGTVPGGGLKSEVLIKASDTDYDTDWGGVRAINFNITDSKDPTRTITQDFNDDPNGPFEIRGDLVHFAVWRNQFFALTMSTGSWGRAPGTPAAGIHFRYLTSFPQAANIRSLQIPDFGFNQVEDNFNQVTDFNTVDPSLPSGPLTIAPGELWVMYDLASAIPYMWTGATGIFGGNAGGTPATETDFLALSSGVVQKRLSIPDAGQGTVEGNFNAVTDFSALLPNNPFPQLRITESEVWTMVDEELQRSYIWVGGNGFFGQAAGGTPAVTNDFGILGLAYDFATPFEVRQGTRDDSIIAPNVAASELFRTNILSGPQTVGSSATFNGNVQFTASSIAITRPVDDDSTQIATTEYVRNEIDSGDNVVNTWNTREGDVLPEDGDYEADMIDYDNTASGLTATDVQAAIDEVSTSITLPPATVADEGKALVVNATGDPEWGYPILNATQQIVGGNF
jgi:hypothetical protein